MPKPDAHIPANYSRLMARELGLSAKRLPTLLAGTTLKVEELLDERCLLTPGEQIRLLENALALTAEPGLGLRLGQRLTPLSHGAMGFMAYSSPNLHMALQAICTFVPTRLSFARAQLSEQQDQLICDVGFAHTLDPAVHRCLCEAIAGMFCSVAEIIVGRRVDEASFAFPYPPPTYQALYFEHLTGTTEFAANCLRISVPMSVARIPNASANHQNYLLALQQCEAMLANMQAQTPSFETRVKQLMLSRPPGLLSEDETAAELFMSKRSVARKLDKEGTSFRRIRDAVLSQQAADYLCRDQLSVEAIASLLNYHDSANFRRAFKRWFGVPPETYRRSHMATVQPANT